MIYITKYVLTRGIVEVDEQDCAPAVPGSRWLYVNHSGWRGGRLFRNDEWYDDRSMAIRAAVKMLNREKERLEYSLGKIKQKLDEYKEKENGQ